MADESLQEAQELLRINRLRVQTGTGIPAGEMKVEAGVAERQQDLVAADTAEEMFAAMRRLEIWTAKASLRTRGALAFGVGNNPIQDRFSVTFALAQ